MTWKPIIDYPEYEISSEGFVKSLGRTITTTAGWHNKLRQCVIKERILKPSKRNGYLFLTLRRNGGHKANMIHHLVAEAFLGKRRRGMVINHINGIKTDNRASNLEYCSKSKNTQHYFNMIGKRGGMVPYSDLPKIISQINSGYEIKSIAKKYNVTRNDIAVLGKIIALTGEELEINL